MAAPAVARLEAAHTHLHPGARLRLAAGSAAPGAGTALQIVFADLAATAGRVLDAEAGTLQVAVEPYLTRRGTLVAARRWLLLPDGDAQWRAKKPAA